MQIVIKIDKKYYDGIRSLEPKTDLTYAYLIRLIKNGTPLPEHHGDLIDKNKLTFNCMADVDCDHKNCNTCQYKCVAKYEIENAIVLKKEGSESE